MKTSVFVGRVCRDPGDSLNGSHRGVTPLSLPERFVTAAAAPLPPPLLDSGGGGGQVKVSGTLLVSEGRKRRMMCAVERRSCKNVAGSRVTGVTSVDAVSMQQKEVMGLGDTGDACKY